MNYIGPTLPPMQPFQLPTGTTGNTGATGPQGIPGPTGLPASETTCFQNIRTTLQHCTGGYVSLFLSGCCIPFKVKFIA
ncbi:exosporium leader peptide-containing protein [Bacillus wiedmannii]|uniref:exosporium leader peptide-containing protein n=1 Tax=Bacillus wiedmannii TaxID=1890302 RepID=UPI0022568BC7|nr:exosporium leader peptide-containing protein [Bacillus wiedmannii]MCX3317416.1 exosporium leader peptide-containing protein [Bacillus wiedmannii]